MLAILWIAGTRVLNGDLSYGSLVSLILYSSTYAGSIQDLTDSLTSIFVASGIAETVFNLYDYQPNNNELLNGGEEHPIKGKIEFKNVSFAYPTKLDVKKKIINKEKITL